MTEAAHLTDRITNYLASGGLFNPEAMEHGKVRDLLIDCRDELNRRATAPQAEPVACWHMDSADMLPYERYAGPTPALVAAARLARPRESKTQRDLMLQAPRFQARLLRNNVGALEDATGRWVHYGVGGKGGADLIGPTTVTITADMVGLQVAVFTAVEVKRPGAKPTDEQQAFLAMVSERGGIACVARSLEDFQGALDEFKSRRSSGAGG